MPEEKKENSSKPRKSITGLAKRLHRLPSDKRKAAIEASASLAAVSLKVSRTFVEAVPKASETLSADDLRNWAELGRRIAMADADAGARFFDEGADALSRLDPRARELAIRIATRQLLLSSSIALSTFEKIPRLADQIDDGELLTEILTLGAEIAGRSAKHSADFLDSTPAVAESLSKFGKGRRDVAASVLDLASAFAGRTGGLTADLWVSMPETLRGLSSRDAVRLMKSATEFLEYGGSVTLHFVSAGASTLRRHRGVFDEWCTTANIFGEHGNAVLIAFLRLAPGFFRTISKLSNKADAARISHRVLELVGKIAETDAESALAAFTSSTKALKKVSLDQFEEWVETGLESKQESSAKARRSFFALETRHSNELLNEAQEGLPLDHVQTVLRIYIEGLTGKEVEIAPLSAMPQESRIGDGKTIYLPAKVDEFNDEDSDFRLYKVLAAHGAGQIEFGTFARGTTELKAAYTELADFFEATAEQLDAFSLAGYIEDVQKGETALSEEEYLEEARKKRRKFPGNAGYREVLKSFPEPSLAAKIFGTMENARIDRSLRHTYRGLVKDLDLMQGLLREKRPYIFDVPMEQVPAELLFQITMCGGATDDARQFYGQIVSEIESVIDRYFTGSESTVADSVMATSRVYSLFQNVSAEDKQAEEPEEDSQVSEEAEEQERGEAVTESDAPREEMPDETQDIRDLFNAWNTLEEEDGDNRDLQSQENWSFNEMPEQPLEPGDEAFDYDEWDRELADFRTGWCRVIEKRVRKGDRNFVELARSRYRGIISSVRHQFQLMKPENLTRINRELDGEEYDLNAVIDHIVDRKADGQQSERLYTKRLRRERDVAVSLLLDQSSSTARTITRNPLQPYTHPGRRIIEIEKEGLVLMSEALEAVGDIYSINGFTSEGRRNVKFYVVKDFDEKYSDDIERRIGGITFQNNTRLGAAIRHASAKLQGQESRTKLLIILTDGRPYDHDYGDAKYAKEDVREALTEAKIGGIIPFCITIDRDSEQELKDLYGEVGYTIIDDVLLLPEKLPAIYRRLTT
ncbi:MAG: VWA domain-containing protein [Acidobacteria bacterium]|nr:MAG: VWA domain-containing protein [Acidobacteriota bacterium]REK02995.1 MAG: VWA domain-containing protein [Acidobacteriota bacterium]REK13201.1 MAG: VWA domain-containing protein [Acidobacteriota bacterium]REK41195.1 MAG: VWA domain-containing protein [Acidobacteriota bacterium]